MKRMDTDGNIHFGIVTPHTGVWIETDWEMGLEWLENRHPPYGGVD